MASSARWRVGGTSAKTSKTTFSLNKTVLASSLTDSSLMALYEIIVYGDREHALRIKVMGLARNLASLLGSDFDENRRPLG